MRIKDLFVMISKASIEGTANTITSGVDPQVPYSGILLLTSSYIADMMRKYISGGDTASANDIAAELVDLRASGFAPATLESQLDSYFTQYIGTLGGEQ